MEPTVVRAGARARATKPSWILDRVARTNLADLGALENVVTEWRSSLVPLAQYCLLGGEIGSQNILFESTVVLPI